MAETRQNRVAWPSISSMSSELDEDTLNQVRGLINDYGLALEDAAAVSEVNIFAFLLFRQFDLVGGLTPTQVLVAISQTAGGVSRVIWRDWRNNPPAPMPADLAVGVRQELGWDQLEILSFDAALLDQGTAAREPSLQEMARERVDRAIQAAEKQARLVRLDPIFQGRDFMIEDELCFVLIPFREPFYRLYENCIKPALEAVGLKVIKADDLFTPTAIIEDIWEYINRSRVIVADVTGRNPNVFYELGIAHTVGKEVIILTQDDNDIPFDLRHLRHFKYTDNEKGWEALRRTLEKAVEAVVGERTG